MQNKFFINYWVIENQLKNNCFEGVRFINYHNDLNKTNILYKISSLNYIKDLINNYKEYIYLSNVLENNKEYLYQILRSDSLKNNTLLYEIIYKITNKFYFIL
jgi:hypothetical protein